MWLALAFVSAFFLGCYDICKKKSVDRNAVIPVLFLNTLFCSLLLLPLVLISKVSPDTLSGTIGYVPSVSLETHGYIFIKSVIVLTSWIFGYFAIKHLPLTITGPINATRPVMTLLGALFIFGERLNLFQWIGVIITIISFFLLSLSGKKEGISFHKNKWIFFMVLAAVAGAVSGLYDKFLMQQFSSTAVQYWFNTYQCLLMLIVLLMLWYPKREKTTPFKWKWSIILVSVFLTIADFVYFYALTDSDAMISIVSMVRRSSVLVSFAGGVLFFHEKNLKGKAIDLVLIIVAMFFLYLGTK
ncbi:DMT family transporter [Dysgonomonas sp.]|jgi:transporter family protein|uniref:DMT family transporter n=1 Tax=Dysgonomonas sp. TaxID=1891233 RepID=UPI00282B7A13|nr:DMT family transporter [Dysgonomonas sp.]MDR2001660.1 DMT family transporter [Prevotella sp.]HMM04240.1 DMT family transporter [Dysgonomonas sp.]